jgi:hypothetical protein
MDLGIDDHRANSSVQPFGLGELQRLCVGPKNRRALDAPDAAPLVMWVMIAGAEIPMTIA